MLLNGKKDKGMGRNGKREMGGERKGRVESSIPVINGLGLHHITLSTPTVVSYYETRRFLWGKH